MAKTTVVAKTPLVELHDDVTNLNMFMDLREQHESIEAKIEILKPVVRKIVQRGKSKNSIDGMRSGQKGKFVITIVPRDLRKPDNAKTIALLRSKGIHAVKVDGEMRPVVKTIEVYDPDAFAKLVQEGTLTREEILSVLAGSVTSYPRVVFKPGQ